MDDGAADAETRTATRRAHFDPAPDDDVLAPAQSVGRFMVLGRVGSGGMGQVYAAYDPALDRRVALKLLHAGRAKNGDGALLQEAQALARLSHPNVVGIHDVGMHGGVVFLAMEFVEGHTLKDWRLRHPSESVAHALGPLLQAGDGLMAAHEANIIHGDFKPQNVLVGRDGRVRVADFGVAKIRRQVAEEVDAFLQSTRADDETSEDAAKRMAGTPVYMAPEQLREGRSDVLSDQYSYCVTAWETLHGCRPPDVNESVDVPPEVTRVLKKGLTPRSAGRYRSMHALLADLRAAAPGIGDTRRFRRRRLTVLAAAATISGALVGGYTLRSAETRTTPCSGAAEALATAWNAEDREQASAALLRASSKFGSETERTVLAGLDTLSREWEEGYFDACASTQIRREQSEHLMDLRMVCLDSRLRELRATVGVLKTMDAERVKNAVKVVEGVPSPRDCSDLDYVLRAPHSEVAPDRRPEVEPLRRKLSEARARFRAGTYKEAATLASDVVREVEGASFTSLRARAQLELGRAHEALGETQAAIKSLESAFLLAETSGDTETASAAASLLAQSVGEREHVYETGMLWANVSVALARRHPESAPRLLASALLRLAAAHRNVGDYESARNVLAEGLSLAPPESLLHASLLSSMGKTLEYSSGSGGTEMLEQALSGYEQLLGPNHPVVANALFDLAQSTSYRGQAEKGLRYIERALVIYREQEGPKGYNVGSATALAADLKASTGDLEAALRGHKQALHILEASVGPNHVEVGAQHARIGTVLSMQGEHEDALRKTNLAAEVMRRTVGPDHLYTRTALTNVAAAQRRAGHLVEAASSFNALLDSLPAGSDPFTIAGLHTGLAKVFEAQGRLNAAAETYLIAAEQLASAGENASARGSYADAAEAYLESGKPALALEPAEKSLESYEEDSPKEELARSLFLVSQALWSTNGDRDRARNLAAEAESLLEQSAPASERLEVVRSWIAAHNVAGSQ